MRVNHCFTGVAMGLTLFSLIIARNSLGAEPLRVWNSADGRQAWARLVSVSGSELQLVSAAGRPVRSTLSAISSADRQYIKSLLENSESLRHDRTSAETQEEAWTENKPRFHLQASEATPPAASPEATQAETPQAEESMPIVRGILDKLPGVPGALGRLASPKAASDTASRIAEKATEENNSPSILAPLLRPLPAELPAELVQVRVSKSFLESFVEREITRKSSIHDQILGTNIQGHARTSGYTELVLHSSDNQAVAEVILRGTIQSRTIGYNGPVRLHCTANTPFVARKIVHIGADGIQSLDTVSTARTHSTTNCIDSTLPGLRGRIATRIAWRRSGDMKAESEAIAARHTRQRLNKQVDESIDRSIKMAQSVFRGKIDQLPTAGAKLPPQMCYRSTPEYLEMVLRSQEIESPDETIVPDFVTDADIAIRVHRAVIQNAVSDPEIRKAIQPLLAGLIPLQLEKNNQTPVIPASVAQERPEFAVSWSDDRDWIQIDFTGRDQGEPRQAVPKNNVAER